MGNLIYLYGIIPEREEHTDPLPACKGLDGEHDTYSLLLDGIEAVVCELDAEEYGEEQLKQKTEDPNWLHEKAFHHHEALMKLYEKYSVIPMKFCTIYSSEESLKNTLEPHKERIQELFGEIEGKEEWILKIYCDANKIKETVAARNDNVEAKREEISKLSPGRQYLEKRKLDQLIDQEAEREKHRFSENIHENLKEMSADTEVKKNWNRDVTGRQEEMCWNSVYMLKKDEVEDFLEKVKQQQEQWKDDGWIMEVTGPWPSYHFAKIS
ncbi:GvpL/GvpF family gas vesicle protein [Virgibacillus sediminis]|uniref:GvpL/GvpF family gas vesicle protein n=1 Tax=Virgibacillus sediminis TaxID=202260 RepID=A0ABV7A772_9BACI